MNVECTQPSIAAACKAASGSLPDHGEAKPDIPGSHQEGRINWPEYLGMAPKLMRRLVKNCRLGTLNSSRQCRQAVEALACPLQSGTTNTSYRGVVLAPVSRHATTDFCNVLDGVVEKEADGF